VLSDCDPLTEALLADLFFRDPVKIGRIGSELPCTSNEAELSCNYLSDILIPTATAYPLLDHINIGFPTKHTIDRGLKNIEETPIHWVHFGNVSD